MIEAKQVTKSFNGKVILKPIDAQFATGCTNLIIGQSGSGKTVFLKSLIGLYDIDGGDIMYDGRSLDHMSQSGKRQLRQEIGMIFQGSALFDSLTVEENVRFPLDMLTELSFEERRERANFCLKRVNLINANNRLPSEISGGMQKRVAIARAIALNPKYLFCDEPNSGLDPMTSVLIDNLIYEITKEYEITTIVNTHDMNSVVEIGEHIIFINNGQKGWEGTKDNVLSTDNKGLNDFIFASELMKQLKR